jgi:hypothetical protein
MANEHFFTLLFLFLLFFVSADGFKGRLLLYVLMTLLSVVLTIELGIGIYEMITAPMDGQDRSLFVTGTFGNSSIFGCYAVVSLPILYGLLEELRPKLRLSLMLLYLVVLLVLLVFTESRAAMVALGLMAFLKFRR